MPYRVVAGRSFSAREKTKEVLTYRCVAISANDELAVLRSANVPRRGCGAKTLDTIRAVAAAEGGPAREALEHASRVISRLHNGLLPASEASDVALFATVS